MASKAKKVTVLTPDEKLKNALVPVDQQPYPVLSNWLWCKLGSICEFERGITFPASAKETHPSESSIPCLRTANIQEELVTDDLIYVNKSYIKGNALKYSRINDIIMSSANSRELVGKTSYVSYLPCPMTFGGFVLTIRTKYVVNKYLFHYLRFEFLMGKFMGESTQTTNIANINTTKLSEYLFPLPPLAEQHRIVARIESLFAKLDEVKEKAQAVVDGYEDRKAAILHKAFTGELTAKWRSIKNRSLSDWKTVTVEEIASVKGGKRVPKGMALTSENTGHPYIKAGNLKFGTVIDKDMMFVPNDVLPFIKNYIVKAGDVYITNVGACIGDCGVIPVKYDGANLTENAVKLTDLQCISEFLALYLSTTMVQERIKSLVASATLGKLSISNIKTISLSLPTKEEQRQVVCLINLLLNKEIQIKVAAESVLDQVDTMKKSILARAFRSELGTNDPSDEPAIELLKRALE